MKDLTDLNITPEDVLAQKAQETVVPKRINTFDLKNYLQARLGENETSKTITIRLLPFAPNEGIKTPFFKVHMHQIKVDKEVSASGWKTFPCPTKNSLGTACPICELAKNAREHMNSTNDDVEKKMYSEIEKMNRAKDMWIVRCIERGHEEDGVKFWLFNSSKSGNGVYNKIMNIWNQRYDKAAMQGKVNNIFDLNNGKDLLITLSRREDGKTAIDVTDDDEKTPLSEDYDKAYAWVNDPKKWNEVYTVKPYDYMNIIAKNGVPMFDKNKNKYVDKKEYAAELEAEITANLTVAQKDLSLGEAKTVFSATTSDNGEEELPF